MGVFWNVFFKWNRRTAFVFNPMAALNSKQDTNALSTQMKPHFVNFRSKRSIQSNNSIRFENSFSKRVHTSRVFSIFLAIINLTVDQHYWIYDRFIIFYAAEVVFRLMRTSNDDNLEIFDCCVARLDNFFVLDWFYHKLIHCEMSLNRIQDTPYMFNVT